MKRFRIEFEMVSATAYPGLYDWRTERARADVDAASIPDDYWHRVERIDDESIAARRERIADLAGQYDLDIQETATLYRVASGEAPADLPRRTIQACSAAEEAAPP